MLLRKFVGLTLINGIIDNQLHLIELLNDTNF